MAEIAGQEEDGTIVTRSPFRWTEGERRNAFGTEERRNKEKLPGFLEDRTGKGTEGLVEGNEGPYGGQKDELTFLHPLPGVREYNVVNSTFSRAGFRP